jgi:hypothetical protein
MTYKGNNLTTLLLKILPTRKFASYASRYTVILAESKSVFTENPLPKHHAGFSKGYVLA